MASENQVGNIVYEVEMNVAKLIEAQQKVNDRLDSMEGKFEKTGKAAGGAEKSFSSLTKVASALTAALSVQQVSQYADAWTTLNNKLANSIRTGESLAEVTQRVFDITQSTRSSLDATASLYARLERATREYGTSAENVAKLTTIINQGFVVSGATAQEAENAIIQLSQGLASGALRGEEFNSVNEQGNRLIVALADSMGVSIGQMRAMAAQGKLTTDVVVNGLLGQGDIIGREFANTTQTIGQAFQVAGNNITQFVGSSATVKAGVAIFNDVVVTLSENLEVVSAVILSVTAIMGSRYVGALAAATAAQISNAAAAYRVASAQGAMGVASGIARGAMALIGGPAGAATLAAAAIFYFYQKSQQAKQEAVDFADKLDGLVSKMKEMSSAQLGAEIAKASQALRTQSDVIEEQKSRVDGLVGVIESYKSSMRIYGESTRQIKNMRDAQENLAIQQAKLEDLENRYSRTKSTINLLQSQQNGQLKQGAELLKRDGEAAGVAAGLMNKFGSSIDFATRTKEKFNATSLQIPRSAKADDFNKDLEDENTLLAITDKRLRAVTKARMEATAKGGNLNQVNTAAELAGTQYDLQAAEAARNTTVKESAKVESQAEQAEKRRQKSLQDLTDQMAVAELQYKGLNREAAQLAAIQDLGSGASSTQMQQASQQAGMMFDIQQKSADKKAALEHDAAAAAERQRTQDLAQVQRQLAAGDISFEQSQKRRAEIAAEYSQQISQANASNAVTPQQAAAGTVDPVQALANENAQKLALIQHFEQQKVITQQQSIALMNAANTQYEQARINAAWQIWENQSRANQMLGDAIDSLQGGATNAITGLLNGTQSLAESFANIGTTILNSVVSGLVEMGLQYVKNMIMGQAAATAALASTAAQATAAAAAWAPAAISASIATMGAASTAGTTAYSTALVASKGLAIAGARKNGGPVSAGSMYQVGEGGMPEIYQASTGKQYMIPGDNGKVISNKDMMGGGGGGTSLNQVMNLTVNTTNGLDDATIKQLRQAWKTDTMLIIRDQSTRPKGMLQGRK